MNPIDYALLFLVLVFFIKGLIQAVPKALISFFYLLLAFFCATIFTPEIQVAVQNTWKEAADTSFLLSFAFLFLILYSLTAFLGWMVSRLFEDREKNALARIGGGFAGILEGGGWCFTLAAVLEYQPFFSVTGTLFGDSLILDTIDRIFPLF